jgi:hypothetical protein
MPKHTPDLPCDDPFGELAARTAADVELMWLHVPLDEAPRLDDQLVFRWDRAGHLVIRIEGPDGDDTYHLTGFPDEPAVFRVRRSVSAGTLDVVAWRNGEEIGEAWVPYADPAFN